MNKQILQDSYIENIHSGVVFHRIQTKTTKKSILEQYSIDPFYMDEKNPHFIETFNDNPLDNIIHKSDLGYKYAILVHNEEKIDMFSAILGDPHEFILNHIKAGFDGTIVKYTNNSAKFIKEIHDKLLYSFYLNDDEYEEYEY